MKHLQCVYCIICLKYSKVKSSTVTVGYDVGVINIIKVHAVMMKPLRGQTNQWDYI